MAGTEDPSKYISPTYKSSPLFAPEVSPTYVRQHANSHNPGWGTHIHQYAGIGDLSFLGMSPKTRDLYVARSHRHFLSGLSYVIHDQVTPTQITPFKKSLNRANDDLVPPAALIPLEKYGRIMEDTQFVREDKYASHKEKSDVFPQRADNANLTPHTAEDIRLLIEKRYGQTTYSTDYYDQRANTTLTLGPQFQFMESDDEEAEADSKKVTAESSISTTSNATSSNDEAKDNLPTDAEDEENDNTEKSASASSSKVENDDNNTEEDQVLEVKTIDALRDEFQQEKKQQGREKPFWPAWPGNHADYIDPVTLKIAEKRDVSCKQDEYDVRALPVSTPLRQPDYKILKALQTVPTERHYSRDFAPARANFAYSGQQVLYGSNAERAQQLQDKPTVATPGCSRFLPVADHVNANIDSILGRNMQQQAPPPPPTRYYDIPEPKLVDAGSRPVASNRLRVRTADSGLDELKSTINDIRAPSAPQLRENYVSLPPLWESLTYSGDRLVDRLGVRFKSKAQARYHQQHPDRIPEILPEYLRDEVTCHNHPCRRRQYYNGYHCGSSFR